MFIVNDRADRFPSGALGSDLIERLVENESGLIWRANRGTYLTFSSPPRNQTRIMAYSPLTKLAEYKNDLPGLIETPDGKFWLSSESGGIDAFSATTGVERTIGAYIGSRPRSPTDSIRGMSKREGNVLSGSLAT